MRQTPRLFGHAITVLLLASCSKPEAGNQIVGFSGMPGTSGSGAAGASAGGGGLGASSGGAGGTLSSSGGVPVVIGGNTGCPKKTCAELGWACGYTINDCGDVTNCADEGLSCGANEVCIGGVMGPTECVSGGGKACELCGSIPKCKNGEVTHLKGRVVTPGRDDTNTQNQVGVPNAIVYILQTADASQLPTMPTGIPSDGTSCDRCEDQDLGPVLNGTVTDATGHYSLDEFIPVGKEFVLVVKAGRFRRATKFTLPESAGCTTTDLPAALPDNPTRLPRSMSDGLAVNIPRIAVSTGQIDAMECVLEKMGLAHGEFANPSSPVGSGAPRINLYRGGPVGDPGGASIDATTPHDSTLYGSLPELESYDIIVSDCEGQQWDADFEQRDENGDKVREFLNRGGRMFASHLSYSWLHENGAQAYDAAAAIGTGLGPAATWDVRNDRSDVGTGEISTGRPRTSPRIMNFSDWMKNENIVTAAAPTFTINQPRSQALTLGPASEEFVFLQDGNERTQQFSFNTPYGAPKEAACGRVAYSGFHVAAMGSSDSSPFIDAVFPQHCAGNLTNQEKVLLYMLFDLGACIGVEPPPTCTPAKCADLGASCGFALDGCGDVLDCGPCMPPP